MFNFSKWQESSILNSDLIGTFGMLKNKPIFF